MVESKWKQKKEASAMETIFYHVDAKQITCQASEDRKASGAAGEVRCVVAGKGDSCRYDGVSEAKGGAAGAGGGGIGGVGGQYGGV